MLFFMLNYMVAQKGQMPCKLGKHRQIEEKNDAKAHKTQQMLNKTPIEKKKLTIHNASVSRKTRT